VLILIHGIITILIFIIATFGFVKSAGIMLVIFFWIDFKYMSKNIDEQYLSKNGLSLILFIVLFILGWY
jgi:hypothetical protein